MKLLTAIACFIPSILCFTSPNIKYVGKSATKITTDISTRRDTSLKATIPLPVTPLIVNSKRLVEAFFTFPLSRIGILWRAVIVICTAFIAKAKANVKAKIVVINAMEMGWTKRGTGSAFSRTVEVWVFAISFLIKYVSYLLSISH